jgi:predicted DNA-binding ribbon-helix-helix protein
VSEIDKSRQQSNLSSAIRLFVLDRVRHPEFKPAGNGEDRMEPSQMIPPGFGVNI